jgi:hypothetical protein
LSCIPEIDSRAEIFNPRRSYHMLEHELTELSRRMGESFEPYNQDPVALKAMRRRPELVLDCLASLMAPEKRILSFKVLTTHLTQSRIEQKIIERPDTIIVFLRRRPVDAFISRQKAKHLQMWRDTDTTGVKVEIDAAEFLKWWRMRAAWYMRLEAACWYRGKRFHHLTYEGDIAGSPAEAARRFRAILEQYGIADLAFPDDARITGLERQDRNVEIADKVSNWPEFERRLEAMDCLEMAFAPFPRFQPTTWDRIRRWLFGARPMDHRALLSRIDRIAQSQRGRHQVRGFRFSGS